MDKRKKEYKQSQDYKDEINAWLESEEKDFDAGFELYARFGHSRALALQLARKRRLSKLVYELEKIVARAFIKESRVWPINKITRTITRNQEHTEAENQVEETGKKLVVTDEKIDYDELPDELKKVYDENRETYKLMRAVHEKMKLATNDQDRAEQRAELVAMDDKIAANWKILDEWATKKDEDQGEDTKVDQEPERETIPAPAELAKELNACRSYLSRNVKKVATLEGKKREELLAKLAERVQTLQKHNAEIKESTRNELVKIGLISEEKESVE